MHYQLLNAALEQYSGSLTQNPASPRQPRPAYRPSNARSSETLHARHSPQTAAEHETAKAAALSQYEKIARQTDHNPQALNAFSQHIIHAFDTHPYLLHTPRAAADIAPKTWLQQLQTYAAQYGFTEEFERVWTSESWPMKCVAAFWVV